MNGTLSQLVTLTSAANGVLASHLQPETFFPGHADFEYCNSVRFVDLPASPSGEYEEVVRHGTPNEWLGSLKNRSVVRTWLTFTPSRRPGPPDHQLVAFVGGGGDWQMVVAADDHTEWWMPRWEVTDQEATDRRIWSVTYGCIARIAEPTEVPPPDLQAAAVRLRTALQATLDFAIRHDLSPWPNWFRRALACLEPSGEIMFPDYVEFVCLSSYPEMARRLLAGAYQGWVFGGMGSWNDFSFREEPEAEIYRRVSAELYSAITGSIEQATWAFGRS